MRLQWGSWLTRLKRFHSEKERSKQYTNISNNLIPTLCQRLLNPIQVVGKGKNPAENWQRSKMLFQTCSRSGYSSPCFIPCQEFCRSDFCLLHSLNFSSLKKNGHVTINWESDFWLYLWFDELVWLDLSFAVNSWLDLSFAVNRMIDVKNKYTCVKPLSLWERLTLSIMFFPYSS